mmetsp:Transcript_56078/g.154511  ORF Transcript_56078/g.154511 Transcript_56078/m.154511 type:complete len:330 (+) Transcript_56078:732-1721(+)
MSSIPTIPKLSPYARKAESAPPSKISVLILARFGRLGEWHSMKDLRLGVLVRPHSTGSKSAKLAIWASTSPGWNAMAAALTKTTRIPTLLAAKAPSYVDSKAMHSDGSVSISRDASRCISEAGAGSVMPGESAQIMYGNALSMRSLPVRCRAKVQVLALVAPASGVRCCSKCAIKLRAPIHGCIYLDCASKRSLMRSIHMSTSIPSSSTAMPAATRRELTEASDTDPFSSWSIANREGSILSATSCPTISTKTAIAAAPTSALVSRRTPSSAKTQAFGGACECGGKSAGFSELCELGQKEGKLRECFRERPDDLLELLLVLTLSLFGSG